MRAWTCSSLAGTGWWRGDMTLVHRSRCFLPVAEEVKGAGSQTCVRTLLISSRMNPNLAVSVDTAQAAQLEGGLRSKIPCQRTMAKVHSSWPSWTHKEVEPGRLECKGGRSEIARAGPSKRTWCLLRGSCGTRRKATLHPQCRLVSA